MTYKEKLIKFMHKKEEILNTLTDQETFFDQADYDYFMNQTEEDCTDIWLQLIDNIEEIETNEWISKREFGYICPNCIRKDLTVGADSDCDDCDYGKRNGFCDDVIDDDDSKFLRFFKKWDCLDRNIRIELFNKMLECIIEINNE